VSVPAGHSSGESGAVLLFGAGGQLGRTLLASAAGDRRMVGVTHTMADITRSDAVDTLVDRLRPAVIVNAAAYTAVDAAEDDVDRAYAVNAIGAGNIARAARRCRARLIHLSTDYVFDGTKGSPYLPDDHAAPLSVYGRSKLEGERAVRQALGEDAVVLRTAWLYSAHGRNFVTTMLSRFAERTTVHVVDDQVGTPTWAASLAAAVRRLIELPDVCGTVHWTNEGVASWYDFAAAIRELAVTEGLLGRPGELHPQPSSDYPTRARRPPYSVLDKTESRTALGLPPEHWRAGLARMLREYRLQQTSRTPDASDVSVARCAAC
jgi:dTDP-4-dehydrorhamnose reductase